MKSHVLLVSDRKPIIKCFTESSIQYNPVFKCTSAQDIAHAWKILDYLLPDIIFIDLEPEVSDALHFILTLKKSGKFSKVIMIAFAEHAIYYQGVSKGMGAHSCIKSPHTAHDIHTIISSLNNAAVAVEKAMF